MNSQIMREGSARGWLALLSPCSPYAFVFFALLAIAVCFMTIPDIDANVSWFLLVLFTMLASTPDKDEEE